MEATTKPKVSARAQRHNELAAILKAAAALVQGRTKGGKPINPKALRALRGAALQFLADVDPGRRRLLMLTAEPGPERADRVRRLADRAVEGAIFTRDFPLKRGFYVRGRARPWSEVVAHSLVLHSLELGLVTRGLSMNLRAYARLQRVLENEKFGSKYELTKLVLRAAGASAREALDWTRPLRKSE